MGLLGGKPILGRDSFCSRTKLSDKLVFFYEGEGKREKRALVRDKVLLLVNGKDQRFQPLAVVYVVNFFLQFLPWYSPCFPSPLTLWDLTDIGRDQF